MWPIFAAILATIIALWPPARAGDDDVPRILHEKFQFAEIIEAADVVASKCFGLHVIGQNIKAASDASGATDEDVRSPEYKFWVDRGHAAAEEGYAKDPAGWCNHMWQFLGPNHPPMVHETLLRHD